MVVLHLYVRYQYNWDAAKTSYFMTLKMIVSFLGNYFTVNVIQEWIGLNYAQTGLVAAVNTLVSTLLFSVTKSGSTMAIFGTFNEIRSLNNFPLKTTF